MRDTKKGEIYMANITESKKIELKVLMVEDSEDDVLLTIRELKKGGYDPVCERVETAAALKKALLEKQWDVMLCDYKMPEFSAPSAIGLLKETNIDIPIIIVSGAIGEETAAECMRLGANDYIIKDNLSRLCPAIVRELEEADSRLKRRQAEETLRFANTILSTQQEMSPDGILVVDPAGKMSSWNQRFVDLWGIPANVIEAKSDELAIQSILDKLVDPEQFLSKVRQLYADTHATSSDDLSLTDGRELERHSAPMVGKDGTHYGRIWYFRDITERKRKEKQLRESEERYRNLFNTTPSGLFHIDLKGFIVNTNPSFVQILGYPNHEAVKSANLFSLCHDPIDAQRLQNFLETKGIVNRIEMCLINFSKEIIWGRLTIWRTIDSLGKIIGYDGIIDDVSEYKMISKLLNEASTSFNDLE